MPSVGYALTGAAIGGVTGGAIAVIAATVGLPVAPGIANSIAGGIVDGSIGGAVFSNVDATGLIMSTAAISACFIAGISSIATLGILLAIPVVTMAAKALYKRSANVGREQRRVPRFDVPMNSPSTYPATMSVL
ncbi:MAG: hypothetical protein LBF42_03440 [Puniceicoccales bacterium]|nr:hypothetical protein [Puniceicoccales bacterium]